MAGKLKKAAIGGLVALLVVTLYGSFHKKIEQHISKSEKEVVKIAAEKPYNIAEGYLKEGEFEDAYIWYDRVRQDFPESEYAKKAQFKKLLINMSDFKKEIAEFIINCGKGAMYSKTALEFSSPALAEAYLKKTYIYLEKAKEDFEQAIGYTDEIWVEFTDIEKYLTDLEVPEELPIGIGTDNQTLKAAYNSIVKEISKDGELDKYKLTFDVARILDYNPAMKEKVDKMLNKIMDETKDDPYNKIRYEVKKYLSNPHDRNCMSAEKLRKIERQLENLLSTFKLYHPHFY